MRIEPGFAPYTELLETGDAMTVTPDGVALVVLHPVGGLPSKESLSAAKRYGPYSRPVAFEVTALGGGCTVVQSAIVAPLWVEGWDDLRFPAAGKAQPHCHWLLPTHCVGRTRVAAAVARAFHL